MNLNENLAKVSKDLMLKEPFYGLYLLMLNKHWSDKVPTAGVYMKGINYQIDINAEFWNSLEHNHKIGLLKHELLHIAFFHLLRRDEFPNKQLANIAMDLEINQYIDSQYLPEGGMTLELFKDLNLEPKKGTRYYYDKLQQEVDNNQKIQKILQAMGDGEARDGDGTLVPNHDWEAFDELSDAEKKLLGSQTDFHLKQLADAMSKGRGTIPGELSDYIAKLLNPEPAKFDWKGYLRRFAGGSIKVYTKKLRRKINRRYEENPGLKIKPKRHVLVAIDTSGSVSNDELVEFMNEIHHIHKTGSDITVVQCDTAISSILPYKPNCDITIKGRGGTDFDPVIEYFNANLNKYTCLIYLTDGEAPAPDPKPKGKTLWALSSISKEVDHLPGVTIKLN
jgi:predicted metal-dependent peptidase